MKRSSQYYGLFNDRIDFNTTTVTPWWTESTEGRKKRKYNIEEDGLADVYGDNFEALYTKYETEGKGRTTVNARVNCHYLFRNY